MVHPIYKHMTDTELLAAKLLSEGKDDHAAAIIEAFIDRAKPIYDGGDPQQLSEMIYIRSLMASRTMMSGFVNIDASRDRWYSELSEKVIREIPVSEFKMPFNAGYIKMAGNGFLFYRDEFGIIISLLHDNGVDRVARDQDITFEPDDILDEAFAKAPPAIFAAKEEDGKLGNSIDTHNLKRQHEIVIVSILSALMYVSLANASDDSLSGTVNRKIVQGKKSAKKGIPKHKISVINVKQKAPSIKSVGGGKRPPSDKMWVVRGHWRNQWYAADGVHKPKWIHPHFKGSGREVAQKVYKL